MPDWPGLRRRFRLPTGVAAYLDGNSLGLLCDEAERELGRTLDEWRTLGIGGWTDATPPWLRLSREVAAGYARVVGAEPRCVVAHGSTTLLIHQALATLYDPERGKILVDDLCFPTDGYAVASHLRLRGLDPRTHLVRVPSRDGYTLDEDDLIAALTPDVAMALLPAVLFGSGQLLDLKRITAAARERGVVVGWDCSHAAGSVPLDLSKLDPDFAIWCGYKYLNGGPGCVAGAYVSPRHLERSPGLAGWFGSSDESMFRMDRDQTPADDAGRWMLGTPHVLSLAPLLGSLRVFDEAGIDAVRRRSLELTDLLIREAEERLSPLGFSVVTPRDPARRGGHVALRHPDAERIVAALLRRGIVTDFRHPDVIRVAPATLYNDESDVARFIVAAAESQRREGAKTGRKGQRL